MGGVYHSKMVKIVKMVKVVCACGWGLGCVTPSENVENDENYLGLWLGKGVCTTVKIVKMVKMVWASCWGVGWVPSVTMVKIVKIVKMVWACGSFFGGVYH